ncbi:MAG TPA: hypothetical protein VF764_01455, partial [Steroidobacteraceae bacterium]
SAPQEEWTCLLGYKKDIKPMFRSTDVDAMKPHGLDLSKYTEVRASADDILSRLQDGSMPCDGRWQQTAIDKFKQWISEGKLP